MINTDTLDPDVVLYRLITQAEAAEFARIMAAEFPDLEVTMVGDLKGGVRKTTATMHLAFALATKYPDEMVIVGDCDQFGSATSWMRKAKRRSERARDEWDQREQAERPGAERPWTGKKWPDNLHVVRAIGDDLHTTLLDACRKHQAKRLLLDTPPNDRPALRRALMLARVLVLTSGPGEMDVERMRPTLDLAKEMKDKRGRGYKFKVLLTGCKIGTKMFKFAREYLEGEGVGVFPNPIRDLQGHMSNAGKVPTELYDYDLQIRELQRMHGHETEEMTV
jgi:cellulose biosynthesis protein BcsQ